MPQEYACNFEVPSIADYCRLRLISGLTPRSEQAAACGLPNTVAGVVVKYAEQAVGMGRVIGDGLHYQVVDVAVDPAHQGRGLGKAIMSSLMEQLKRLITAEAYVSLIADGDAHKLYSQYGFASTAPASIGMAQWIMRDAG